MQLKRNLQCSIFKIEREIRMLRYISIRQMKKCQEQKSNKSMLTVWVYFFIHLFVYLLEQ